MARRWEGGFEYNRQQNIIYKRSWNFDLQWATLNKLVLIGTTVSTLLRADVAYFISPTHRTVLTFLSKCLCPATDKRDHILDLWIKTLYQKYTQIIDPPFIGKTCFHDLYIVFVLLFIDNGRPKYYLILILINKDWWDNLFYIQILIFRVSQENLGNYSVYTLLSQGSVFAGIAAGEMVFSMASTLGANAVYDATVAIYGGFTFFVMAGYGVIGIILCL